VCRYVTEKYHYGGGDTSDTNDWSSAFDVIVKNEQSGSVELRLKKGLSLDCSDSPYRFYMRAERCEDLSMSDRYRHVQEIRQVPIRRLYLNSFNESI